MSEVRALFDAVMAADGEEMTAIAERCHSDDCDHIAALETRVRELLTANGEMAYLWAEQQDRIATLETDLWQARKAP